MPPPADFPPPVTEWKGSFVIHLWENIKHKNLNSLCSSLLKLQFHLSDISCTRIYKSTLTSLLQTKDTPYSVNHDTWMSMNSTHYWSLSIGSATCQTLHCFHSTTSSSIIRTILPISDKETGRHVFGRHCQCEAN
jgi:hypothetical protein